MDLELKKKVFYFLALLSSCAGFALLLWFFQAANLKVLEVHSFDYCDLILVHIILEVFISILACIGFFFIPDTVSAKFLGIVTTVFLGARFIFLILFYLSHENKLFNAEISYYKRSQTEPEKLIAFQAVYYFNGVSMGLEIIFMVIATFFALKVEKSHITEIGNFYIEIGSNV